MWVRCTILSSIPHGCQLLGLMVYFGNLRIAQLRRRRPAARDGAAEDFTVQQLAVTIRQSNGGKTNNARAGRSRTSGSGGGGQIDESSGTSNHYVVDVVSLGLSCALSSSVQLLRLFNGGSSIFSCRFWLVEWRITDWKSKKLIGILLASVTMILWGGVTVTLVKSSYLRIGDVMRWYEILATFGTVFLSGIGQLIIWNHCGFGELLGHSVMDLRWLVLESDLLELQFASKDLAFILVLWLFSVGYRIIYWFDFIDSQQRILDCYLPVWFYNLSTFIGLLILQEWVILDCLVHTEFEGSCLEIRLFLGRHEFSDVSFTFLERIIVDSLNSISSMSSVSRLVILSFGGAMVFKISASPALSFFQLLGVSMVDLRSSVAWFRPFLLFLLPFSCLVLQWWIFDLQLSGSGWLSGCILGMSAPPSVLHSILDIKFLGFSSGALISLVVWILLSSELSLFLLSIYQLVMALFDALLASTAAAEELSMSMDGEACVLFLRELLGRAMPRDLGFWLDIAGSFP
ncbi:hypothetical protein Scep_026755 [Stephania cephalantha]|uniref:Uncharacterized protein n=1 Tax=Stephania cephalantha TaxID=152367 RepID=A0AAP0EKR8_9MAGN